MLYDRPYMRHQPGHSRQIPVFAWILIVNATVFVLQNVLQLMFGIDGLLRASGGRGGFLLDWFALTEGNLMQGKVWVLLTYSLFHGSFFHLLVNSLLIFFVGRIVEMISGGAALLRVYILSVFLGGAAWALVNLFTHSGGLVIGASGGAMGILIYFCLLRPNEPITLLLFFVLPVTVLPKWVAWAVLAFETFGLVFSEIGPMNDFVAHSAHLGGMAGGFLFFKFESWFRKFSLPRIRFGKGRKDDTAVRPRYKVNVSSPKPAPVQRKKSPEVKGSKDLRSEIDRILDKINADGFGSLSEDERQTLNKAKELLKK